MPMGLMMVNLARKRSLGNLQQCRVPTFVLCSDTEILWSIRHCPTKCSDFLGLPEEFQHWQYLDDTLTKYQESPFKQSIHCAFLVRFASEPWEEHARGEGGTGSDFDMWYASLLEAAARFGRATRRRLPGRAAAARLARSYPLWLATGLSLSGQERGRRGWHPCRTELLRRNWSGRR